MSTRVSPIHLLCAWSANPGQPGFAEFRQPRIPIVHTQLIPLPQSQCQPNRRIGIALGTRLISAWYNAILNNIRSEVQKQKYTSCPSLSANKIIVPLSNNAEKCRRLRMFWADCLRQFFLDEGGQFLYFGFLWILESLKQHFLGSEDKKGLHCFYTGSLSQIF